MLLSCSENGDFVVVDKERITRYIIHGQRSQIVWFTAATAPSIWGGVPTDVRFQQPRDWQQPGCTICTAHSTAGLKLIFCDQVLYSCFSERRPAQSYLSLKSQPVDLVLENPMPISEQNEWYSKASSPVCCATSREPTQGALSQSSATGIPCSLITTGVLQQSLPRPVVPVQRLVCYSYAASRDSHVCPLFSVGWFVRFAYLLPSTVYNSNYVCHVAASISGSSLASTFCRKW